MSFLVTDGFEMSRMRFAAGDSLFSERPNLGRNPIQLHFIAIIVLCDGSHHFPEKRKGLCRPDQRHCLLDRVGGVSAMVGREEPDRDLER